MVHFMGIYTYLPQELRPFERIVTVVTMITRKMPYWGFVSLGVGIHQTSTTKDAHWLEDAESKSTRFLQEMDGNPPAPCSTSNILLSKNISATFQREREPLIQNHPWSLTCHFEVVRRLTPIHPNCSRWIELQLDLFMSLASKISQRFCLVPSCIPSTSKNSTRFLTKALAFGNSLLQEKSLKFTIHLHGLIAQKRVI